MTGLAFNIDSKGVAWLTLNRPQTHNAFDDKLIASLIRTLDELACDTTIRALVLRAEGKHFSSGADLNWMKSMINLSPQENMRDAQQLARLLHKLDTFPTPTLVLVQGAAYGGALGLICCCDIAIGTPNSLFCLSEVKLGLLPATIGPYVIRTIGHRQSRRYFLTAEVIDKDCALRLGILHHVCDQPDKLANTIIEQLVSHGPNALEAAKKLCLRCDNEPIDQALMDYTSQAIASARTSAEGQEGLKAFLAKRSPDWR